MTTGQADKIKSILDNNVRLSKYTSAEIERGYFVVQYASFIVFDCIELVNEFPVDIFKECITFHFMPHPTRTEISFYYIK